MLDPDPHGSETFAWIWIRNKSFRIHNTALNTVLFGQAPAPPKPYLNHNLDPISLFTLNRSV